MMNIIAATGDAFRVVVRSPFTPEKLSPVYTQFRIILTIFLVIIFLIWSTWMMGAVSRFITAVRALREASPGQPKDTDSKQER